MLDSLMTPCALLDQAVMLRNCEGMAVAAQTRGAPLRIHLKTAKSRDVAQLAATHFGERATVSTLAEIATLRGCGFTDFLYAVAVVPSKFDAIAALLADDCAITVTLDNLTVAEALVDYCKARDIAVPAVIEIDLDGHRSGVSPDDHLTLVAIAQALNAGGLMRGVMTHAGGSYALDDAEALRVCAHAEADRTALAASHITQAGLPCPLVSVGSTPTALADTAPQSANELRAGVFVFFDLVQVGIGVCRVDDIALSVLARVISVNPARQSVVIDAGWMALSPDRGTASQRQDCGYGLVCDEQGQVVPNVIVADAQQEHGIIRVRPGSAETMPQYKPGDMVRILPNHACATAAQHTGYHVLDSGNRVVAFWPRHNHW